MLSEFSRVGWHGAPVPSLSELPAGEHLLATAKLSMLNQLAAPLLGAGARVFVAARLPDVSGGSSVWPGLPCPLSLLTSLRRVKAVCSKGHEPSASQHASNAASWLPCSKFLQDIEQRQQAEQQHSAEASALAAAEAARRDKLQAAAHEWRHKAVPQVRKEPCDEPAQQPSRQQQKQEKEVGQRAGDALEPSTDVVPANQQDSGMQPTEAPLQQDEQQAARAAAAGSQAGESGPPAEQAAPAALAQPGCTCQPGSPATGGGSSLEHLRQQFQSLYAAVAVPQCPAAAAGQPGSPVGCGQSPTGRPGRVCVGNQVASPDSLVQLQHQRQPCTIAQGVAAADDIATHVAALRMQAAAEAKRALQARRELLDGDTGTASAGALLMGGRPAAGAADEPTSVDFAWIPGHNGGGGPGSGSLGEKLEAELLQLQQEAAAGAASAATPAQSGVDLASLAELEAGLPSLAAVFRAPASSTTAACTSGARRSGWKEGPHSTERSGVGSAAAAAANGAAMLAESPAASTPWYTDGPEVSDLFQSDHMPLLTAPQGRPRPAAAVAVTAAAAAAPPAMGSTRQPASVSDARLHSGSPLARCNGGKAAPCSRAVLGAAQQPDGEQRESWQGSGSTAGDCGGSYAASWRQRADSSSPVAANAAAAAAGAGCSGLGLDAPAGSSSGSVRSAPQQHRPLHEPLACPARTVLAGSSQLDALEAMDLREELQREQRVSAALLQQLQEVQQALEEAVAAAAAAEQPLAPGVHDPADFNGLLAGARLSMYAHMLGKKDAPITACLLCLLRRLALPGADSSTISVAAPTSQPAAP